MTQALRTGSSTLLTHDLSGQDGDSALEDVLEEGEPVNLDRSECFARLVGNNVGRLSLTVGALPTIVPAHYKVVGNELWIEPPEGQGFGKVSDNSVVAFQTDGQEEGDHAAWWSVVVIGLANRVDEKLSLTITNLTGSRLDSYAQS